ncbi:liprin-beta 1 isoform X2 [Arctopsyche grandis]|uniref:liprin-beta 1 isoform X2 n=1 Tax=Arctopsyche grandis TaxID=121162 RepID=UPI00406D6E90
MVQAQQTEPPGPAPPESPPPGVESVTGAGAAGGGACVGGAEARSSRSRALELAQQLAAALQHAAPPPPRPDYTTAAAVLRWLSPHNHHNTNSEATDDRVRRLESDKESLQLQVSVLSEQIAAQSEKINDLERLLNEKRNLLANAEELLQREMLTRSSLETQKLELMSTVSESRLRQAALERENIELRSSTRPSPGLTSMIPNGAARRHSPSPSPSPASSMIHHARDNTPRTPPATYRRLVNDQSPHSYSSLPRGASLTSTPGTPRSTAPLDTAVVLRSVGFADKDTVIGTASSPILGKTPTAGKGWGSLFKGSSGGALEDITDGDVLDPFQRGGVRATAAPRLQSTQGISNRWSSIPLKEWDMEVSCEWLEMLGLDCYSADAKKWLTNPAGNKGILATATPHQIERELNIKNALHKKKIVLALTDLQGTSSDPLLAAAGRLDSSWALRWLEDAGLPQYREAWAAARADGRVLHRLCHEDLQTLKVTSQLHALSIRRGIQVLRENNFSPDSMIRRGESSEIGPNAESDPDGGHVSRWSSHRVMEWLRAVDLAEYAPNLRGAGVHGGLMYYETRFTGELLATLLNIPPSKTLLRRHLNTRFNQLLGKEIIQEKREAEQTLGYQPLTLTSKVKVVKKGQFTLKRKKNKGEAEYGDLVCPIIDQASGEILSTMKMEVSGGEAVAACRSDEMSNSTDSPLSQRSDHSQS